MVRVRDVRAWMLASICAALFPGLGYAASINVSVPGVADIWLASQPNGTVLNGGFPGSDVAPANSPVLASGGLTLTAGSYLTVSASGSTDYNGCASPSPDGGSPCGAAPIPAALGISGYNGPINALVGVFLDASTPSGTAPAAMDFSTLGSLAQATVSPQLRQVFFIGDGLTGTGAGTQQRFVIPAGATRLFLASSDGVGASYNNFGAFAVVVNDALAAPSGSAAIPAASPLMLVLIGLMVAGVGTQVLRSRASARRRVPDRTA